MSSSSGKGIDSKEHVLHEFKEIITKVRECKTAAEEREFLNKEKALIRERFVAGKEETRAKDVGKLLYIAMLGHNTDFGQMECLKLISSQDFGNKRIGYLGLCQLFHENSEVLMLATHRIHLDLNHTNNYVVSMAIVALSEICTAEMCRELVPDLIQTFSKASTFIKKKAALCCVKMVKRLPEATSEIVKVIDALMEDKHHGVLLSTVSLMRSLILESEENKNYFYKYITPLKKILKALLSNMSAEFDVDGINDPFLQMMILEFFRLMSSKKQHVADEISGILGEVATNTKAEKNSGCAVLVECVKTVMEMGSTASLKILCLNVLGKFLKSNEPNIKYASLFMIQKVLIHDIKTVEKYMSTILACLKEEDLSIKQLALDLVYMVSNHRNVEAIVKELLNHMIDKDQINFLPEIVLKTSAIIDKFAPSRRWQIDTTIKVLSIAGKYAKEDSTNSLINLISVTPSLQQYAVTKLYYALNERIEQTGLAIAALYCFGEFGVQLVKGSKGVEGGLIRECDLISLIERTFKAYHSNDEVKEYGVSAMMKLVSQFKTIQLVSYKAVFDSLSKSVSPEIQKRACEYLSIISGDWNTQLEYVFQTGVQYAAALQAFASKPIEDTSGKAGQVGLITEDLSSLTGVNNQQGVSLLDGLIGSNPQESTGQSGAGASAGLDLLNDLIGGDDVGGGGAAAVNGSSGFAGIDLLDDIGSQTGGGAAQQVYGGGPPAAASGNIIDLLGGDDNQNQPLSGVSSFPVNSNSSKYYKEDLLEVADDFYEMRSSQPVQETHVFTPMQDGNIQAVFKCTKVAEDRVDIVVEFGNKTMYVISDLLFQVAVKKITRLTMNPISSTTIVPASTAATKQVRADCLVIMNICHTQPGQKGIALKVRLSYTINGVQSQYENRN